MITEVKTKKIFSCNSCKRKFTFENSDIIEQDYTDGSKRYGVFCPVCGQFKETGRNGELIFSEIMVENVEDEVPWSEFR